MKCRWLAIAIALAAFSAGPWTHAQVQDQDKDQPKASDAQAQPAAPPAALPTADDSQVKHDGGKMDVDAVGNRNVGCGRGVGNWYTVEGQVARGRVYAQQIEAQVKLVNDPVVTEYVNRIGQNLVRNSDAQVPFTIKVIDSDVVNAMALPGGFFYVNSGLILAADEEAEMAGVMAHEIAHVAACHYGREMTRANLLQMASIPFIFMGGVIGYAGYEAASIGIPLTFFNSRAVSRQKPIIWASNTCTGRDTIRRRLCHSSRKSRRWRRRNREHSRRPSILIPRRQTGSRSPRKRFARFCRRRRNTL